MQISSNSGPTSNEGNYALLPAVENQKKKKRKTKSEDQADDVFALLGERLRSSSNKDDQFAIFGKNVAVKLKVLPK